MGTMGGARRRLATAVQSTVRKNGCCRISVAPAAVPSRWAGFLRSSWPHAVPPTPARMRVSAFVSVVCVMSMRAPQCVCLCACFLVRVVLVHIARVRATTHLAQQILGVVGEEGRQARFGA
jgi:hypothetical protein